MNYEEGLEILRHAWKKAKSGEMINKSKLNYKKIINGRDEVLAKYQPIFNSEKVGDITVNEFQSFLRFDNNRHWTQLHRSGDSACRDMNSLREGLKLLLDESKPIAERLTDSIHMIHGVGKGITTAILMVAYPNKYGVWNNRSEKALMTIGIWPDFSAGENLRKGRRVYRVPVQDTPAKKISRLSLF